MHILYHISQVQTSATRTEGSPDYLLEGREREAVMGCWATTAEAMPLEPSSFNLETSLR